MKKYVVFLFVLLVLTGCDKKIVCNKISENNEFYSTKISYEYKFNNDDIKDIFVTIETDFTDKYLSNSNADLKEIADTYKEELSDENIKLDIETTDKSVILKMKISEEYALKNKLSLASSLAEVRRTFEKDDYTCN